MGSGDEKIASSTSRPTRLRIVGASEPNFLVCLKHGVWGSESNRFKEWEPGDLVAFRVDEGIAGLAEVTGPLFESKEPLWTDKVYPYRIPIRIVHATRAENRLKLDQIKDLLATGWAERYAEGPGRWGLGIRDQVPLAPTESQRVLEAIMSHPNDLVTSPEPTLSTDNQTQAAPASLRECLKQVLDTYNQERLQQPYSRESSIWSIFERMKTALQQCLPVASRNEIMCSWGAGKGGWAAVPWIALLDKRETTSTQRGVYAVFLFRSDMSGVYLTLNQGVQEPKDRLGRKRAREFLRKNAEDVRRRVKQLAEVGFALDGSIDLRAEAQRASDYECATIAHKLYSGESLPTDPEMNNDLENLLRTYQSMVTDQVGPGKRPVTSWIFQANPKFFDIDAAILELSEVCWLINQHSDEIHENDQVFLWKSGIVSGIVALATVLSGPTMMDEPNEEQRFNIDKSKFEGLRLRVRLRIDRVVKPTLSRSTMLEEPKLSNLSILKAPQGTNFPVTDDEAAAILDLISLNTDVAEEPEELAPYSIEDALSGLFLSETAIREMLRRWRLKKNLILQGPPGVGKTFVAKRLAYALIGFKDVRKLRMIQFHQSFSYEDFMQGYRPSPNGGFVRKDGPFFEFCMLAANDPAGVYVFLIDEINRGNLSKIFGEALMLIEADKRSFEYSIKLTYSTPGDAAFFAPPNVYILGTMNTADRSIALVDYALRRRFAFVSLEPQIQSAAFKTFLRDREAPERIASLIVERITALNREISDDSNLGPAFAIGHSFFCPSDLSIVLDDEWYYGVVETEVVPLLREYWFDDQRERAEQWRTRLLAPM